jgi:hypothetical protein
MMYSLKFVSRGGKHGKGKMMVERMIAGANFPARIFRDSIKFHAEFFMMPAFTPNSKLLRERDINDPVR